MAAFTNAGHQVSHLAKMCTMFKNMKTDEGKQLPCFTGWQISIQSFLNLWQDLSAVTKIHFVLTNRMNQDCLENFFGSIRASGVTRDNPDSGQFRAAYRMICTNQVFTHASGKKL